MGRIGRKAQGPGEIFVYILAIVVLSMILFFGYRAITGFGKQSEQVSYIQLKTELENAVRQIRSDYGSVSVRQFEIPGKYKSLCFAGSDAVGTAVQSMEGYYIIGDSIASGTESNAFLFPEGTESFNIGKIEVDIPGFPKDFGCITAAGSIIRVRLEGLGDRTKISLP